MAWRWLQRTLTRYHPLSDSAGRRCWWITVRPCTTGSRLARNGVGRERLATTVVSRWKPWQPTQIYSDWRKGSRNRHGGWKKTGMSNRLPHRVEETRKSVDTVWTLFKVSIEATCPNHERNTAFPASLGESQSCRYAGLRDER